MRQLETAYRPTAAAQSTEKKNTRVEQAARVTAEVKASDNNIPGVLLSDGCGSSQALIFLNASDSSDDDDDDDMHVPVGFSTSSAMQRSVMMGASVGSFPTQQNSVAPPPLPKKKSGTPNNKVQERPAKYLQAPPDDVPTSKIKSGNKASNNDPSKIIHFQPDPGEPAPSTNTNKIAVVGPTKSITFLPNEQDDCEQGLDFGSFLTLSSTASASTSKANNKGFNQSIHFQPDRKEPKHTNNESKTNIHFVPNDNDDDQEKPPPSALFNSRELVLAVHEDSSSDTDSGDYLGGPIAQSEVLLSSSPADNQSRSVEMDAEDLDDAIRRSVSEQGDDPAPEPIHDKYTGVVLPVVLRMPNTGFGIVMGLAGNSMMWKIAGLAPFITGRVDTDMYNTILWLSGFIVGIMIFLTYVYKAIFSFDIVVMEYKDPVRVHFMNTPHLSLLMLAMGTPRDVDASERTLQIIFAVGLLAQTSLTQFIYEKWMFSQNSNISNGRPQFLLSVVGWFLLSVLGQQANIDDSWGIALPSFCFGVGAIFYVMVVISVFNRLHEHRNQKGSPALTLLIAPPAVAVMAIDGFDGDPSEFSVVAEMLLGWCFIVLLLILKMGPHIAENPNSFGTYWAYVFPLSALATSCVRYAIIRDTRAADIVAVIFMGVAVVALLVVLIRMVVHMVLCCQGKKRWEDPLLAILPNEEACLSLDLRESLSLDFIESPPEIEFDPQVQFETTKSAIESESPSETTTDPTSNIASRRFKSHGINIAIV